MAIATSTLTLTEFLRQNDIDESPAKEYVQHRIYPKPTPGGKHSRLQHRLITTINTTPDEYEALPELRCTFGDRSLVPDISVLPFEQLPIDEAGDISSAGLSRAPWWAIEILSPGQNQTRVIRNLLHCLRYGSQLGWLIAPEERFVLIFRPDSLPLERTDEDSLLLPEALTFELTPRQLFAWLKVP